MNATKRRAIKSFIAVAFLLLSLNSFGARLVCSAHYAVDFGHYMKGQVLQFSNLEFFELNQEILDSFYSLKISKVGEALKVDLKTLEDQSQVQVKMIEIAPDIFLGISTPLEKFPRNVPGSPSYESTFLMVMCAEESNLP